MKPLSIGLCIIYWAILIFDIALILTGADFFYRYFTKGLLMPVLFGIIISEVEHTDKWWSIRVISIALLFSLIGDLVLVGDGLSKINFAIGLACFWVVQICYILFFYRKRPFRKKNSLFLFLSSLCILGYIIVMNILMWTKMDRQSLTLPVLLYSFTIGFMLLCAININNSKRLYKIAVSYFIPGAIFFVVSDSILALNRFYYTHPVSDVYIMFTYGLAQFLIVCGAVKFIKR
jgi:uncharacterized membrane protein YhhN